VCVWGDATVVPPRIKPSVVHDVPQVEYSNTTLHKDAALLMQHMVDKQTPADKEAVARFWSSFLLPFFHLGPDYTPIAVTAAAAAASGGSAALSVRDIVTTPYGVGIVEGVRPATATSPVFYEVLLTWCGRAVLQESVVRRLEGDAGAGAGAGAGSAAASDDSSDVLYCSYNALVFFRLHQVLTVRCGRECAVCNGARVNRRVSRWWWW
jgi:hypothetical protein